VGTQAILFIFYLFVWLRLMVQITGLFKEHEDTKMLRHSTSQGSG